MVQVKHKLAVIEVSASCPTHSRTEVKVRDTQSVIDEPLERGGTNQGPSPTEALIAAITGCSNVVINKLAKANNVEVHYSSHSSARRVRPPRPAANRRGRNTVSFVAPDHRYLHERGGWCDGQNKGWAPPVLPPSQGHRGVWYKGHGNLACKPNLISLPLPGAISKQP